MENKRIKIGLIGVGGTIGRFHTRLLVETVPDAEVVKLQDIRHRACDETGKQWGIPTCTDAEDLIGDPEIEGVVIASWDETHAGYIKACLSAGKAVFCEKPV